MAKSIRSKRMRKLRAFKRIRYGEKELVRLKNMIAKAAEEEKVGSRIINEDICTVNTNSSDMDVDSEGKNKVIKPPKYPCWLSQYKIKKLAKRERKCKRKENKRLKKQKKIELRKKK